MAITNMLATIPGKSDGQQACLPLSQTKLMANTGMLIPIPVKTDGQY
jgi:hypothetical protein